MAIYKHTRDEAFDVVDGELDYQEERWNSSTTPTEGQHTVAEFCLYMEHYLQEARKFLSTQGEPKASEDGLDFIRKVTAMGVNCMMQNGYVRRAGH